MKKNLEGRSPEASGTDGRAWGPWGHPSPVRPWAHASGLVSPLEALSGCGSVYSNGGPGSLCDQAREADHRPPPEPTLTSHSFSPAAPSGHQHRHTTGEKHTKETGGKGKKNRNLKIGRITVSEKWRESVFRQITNANELKYLDEFLLNKVGQHGFGGHRTGTGWGMCAGSDLGHPGCHHPAECSGAPF